MIISNRQMKMMETLKEAEQPVPIKQFAESFGVSVRTIQNDINSIDCFLQSNQLPTLKRCHKGCVSLGVEDSKLSDFLNSLSGIEAKDVILTPEERIHALYMLLMEQRGYIMIATLCERLGVSKGTMLNDLNRLRGKIQALPFDIVSNSRYGIRLTGDECGIREFALNSYMEYTDVSCIYDVSDYYKASICTCNRICKTRRFEDTERIYNQLRAVEDTIGRKLTDRSFLLVISWIELAIDRISNDKIISIERRKLESLFESLEFKASYKLARNLSKTFDIRFPIEEIGHIAIRLIGCNDTSMTCPDKAENYAEFQLVICRLIQEVGNGLNVDFSSNVSLYNDLVHHIRPAIYRVKNKINLKNPLLQEIKSNYPSVFNAVKRSIGDIERLIGAGLPEDEIGYIAIYFASIIEKERHNEKIRPNILIVCDSGVGTCNLLTARITSIYEVNIVAKVAYYELERALGEHPVDYILSTVDISHDSIRVFKVSPMISEKDKLLLDPYFQRRFNRVLDIDRLMEILERNCVILDKNRLIKELGEEYSLIVNEKRERGNDKMLKDVMDKKMIELDFPAHDWKEAVREAGKLLINGGCVEEKYVESMVDVVKSMGAYIVIGKGIALPHSRSAEGANKIGISFLRLATPVYFGHPENDPVDLLFGLSSIDNKSHIRALKDLTKVLSDEEKVEKLRTAGASDEIFSLLTE
ncbi:MAG: BglG family transcription antiterminator [Bacteroidota bacterium]